MDDRCAGTDAGLFGDLAHKAGIDMNPFKVTIEYARLIDVSETLHTTVIDSEKVGKPSKIFEDKFFVDIRNGPLYISKITFQAKHADRPYRVHPSLETALDAVDRSMYNSLSTSIVEEIRFENMKFDEEDNDKARKQKDNFLKMVASVAGKFHIKFRLTRFDLNGVFAVDDFVKHGEVILNETYYDVWMAMWIANNKIRHENKGASYDFIILKDSDYDKEKKRLITKPADTLLFTTSARVHAFLFTYCNQLDDSSVVVIKTMSGERKFHSDVIVTVPDHVLTMINEVMYFPFKTNLSDIDDRIDGGANGLAKDDDSEGDPEGDDEDDDARSGLCVLL